MESRSKAILEFKSDENDESTFLVDQEDVLIGRDSECDITLDDPQVSRFHASLRHEDREFWLLDMDSTNGTIVDGDPIPPNQRYDLEDGQTFSIGSYIFSLHPPTDVRETTLVQPDAPSVPTYDVEAVRSSQFPAMTETIHLDNGAGAPTPVRTTEKMQRMLGEDIGTADWNEGANAFRLYENFQHSVADFLNAKLAHEIVYAAGCSAGLNLIAQSLDIEQGDEILFCDLEHSANVYPWMSLKRDGASIRQIESVNGGLTVDAVKESVTDKSRVVTVSAVQFFSGHRTPLKAIGEFCRERGILFVVDAIQAVGHMPIDVQESKIDVLVSGGHKSLMAAPTAGFMYVREPVASSLNPRVIGATSTQNWLHYLDYDPTPGAAAWRFLIGTPNFVGMAGAMESIDFIQELTREAIDHHTRHLTTYALRMARSRDYDETTTLGEHGPIATFNMGRNKEDTEELIGRLLDDFGVRITQHLDRKGQPHLRLSFHCYNTEEDVDAAFAAIDQVTAS